MLGRLNAAEAFETFLQTKFVGQKRFSLEGAETTIPLIDEICEAAAEAGAAVTLVSGPTPLATPPGVLRIDVTSAAQMAGAVLGRLAKETGGFLLENTNDLAAGVARMQQDRTS